MHEMEAHKVTLKKKQQFNNLSVQYKDVFLEPKGLPPIRSMANIAIGRIEK